MKLINFAIRVTAGSIIHAVVFHAVTHCLDQLNKVEITVDDDHDEPEATDPAESRFVEVPPDAANMLAMLLGNIGGLPNNVRNQADPLFDVENDPDDGEDDDSEAAEEFLDQVLNREDELTGGAKRE